MAQDVELAESVSMAMLTVLETLGPIERAVFVLREVFDTPYDEIAEAVEKSPSAVRQIAHRAREHVQARRPRMSVSRAEQEEAVDRFRAALVTGDVQGLIAVLAPDVAFRADGGGVVAAAIRPLSGPKTIARVLSRFAEFAGDVPVEATWLNGAPALRLDPGGRVRQRGQPDRRGRADHAHLRDPQPPQAGQARQRGRAQPLGVRSTT